MNEIARNALDPTLPRDPARPGVHGQRCGRQGPAQSRGRRDRDRAGSGQGRLRQKWGYVLPAWWPDWEGERCIVLGAGPSAQGLDLERAARLGWRICAINRSWELCPGADLLYGADGTWWRSYGGVPEFAGLKLTATKRAADQFDDVHLIEVASRDNRLLMEQPGRVGHGLNSGFQVVNLLAQVGVAVQLLCGIDMRLDHGLHWHGPHKKGLGNPSQNRVREWRAALDGIASDLARLDVRVVNASPISALRAYEKMTFDEAIKCLS